MDWEAAAAFTEDAVSTVFDTTACRLLPMISPHGGRDLNARPVADVGRVEFDFMAMLDLEPSQDSIPRHLSNDPGVNGTMVSYDAVITMLTDPWPYLAKRGDRVLVGDVVFQIMLDRQDGSSRRAFYLNRVK
jgi:hypothetical protein